MNGRRPHSLALFLVSIVPAFTVIWSVDFLTPVLVGLPIVTTLMLVAPHVRLPWRNFGVLVVGALIISLASLFYARASGAVYLEWGFITISDGSFEVALSAFARLLAIGLPAIVVFPEIEAHELVATLVVRRVVPQRVALATLIALRLSPVIVADLAETRVARRAAGKSTRFGSLVVTTLVIAIRRAIRMSEIAEVRGFSAPNRVWVAYRKFSWRDWALVLGAFAIAVATLSITVLTGAWNSAI
ncbi:MAG: energy-coupling factor transporter transmembrane component T family protein [Microbacteriaceae bacterium]